VLRDENGVTISSACRHLLKCSYPFEAEARACEEGLRLSMQWSDKPIVLELDCKLLIDAIQEKGQDRSHFAHMISVIKSFCNGS
jgi:hypothetical protein